MDVLQVLKYYNKNFIIAKICHQNNSEITSFNTLLNIYLCTLDGPSWTTWQCFFAIGKPARQETVREAKQEILIFSTIKSRYDT